MEPFSLKFEKYRKLLAIWKTTQTPSTLCMTWCDCCANVLLTQPCYSNGSIIFAGAKYLYIYSHAFFSLANMVNFCFVLNWWKYNSKQTTKYMTQWYVSCQYKTLIKLMPTKIPVDSRRFSDFKAALALSASASSTM